MAEKSEQMDFTNCRICLSSFTNPRLLQCLHIFCTPCLESLAGDKTKLTCPLCRAEELLPITGVKGIPVYQSNVKLEIREEHTDSICQLCEERKLPSVKCLDCDIYLCSDCHGYHAKLKMSNNHQYERLETYSGGAKNSTLECNNHKKELTLFCKPCNKALCAECVEVFHREHEVLSLEYTTAMEKDALYAAVIGLQSKVIPSIENAVVQTNSIEDTLYKQSNQIKQELKTHATALKKVFGRYVDIAMNSNLIEIEKLTKHEVKKIVAYRDGLEMDKISFASLLHTSEEIIKSSANALFLKESTNLKRRLDYINRYEGPKLQTNILKFTSTEITEQQIRNSVGNVKLSPVDNLKLSFRQLPIPELQTIKGFKLKNTFNTESLMSSVVPGKDGNAWILHDSYISRYSCDGKLTSKQNIDSSNISTLLRRQDGSIFFWMNNYAREFDSGDDDVDKLYKVPFEDGNVGCFLSNNNLVVFNPTEKTFYEIDADGCVQRTVNNEKLSDVLTLKTLNMIETDDGNWIIAQDNKVLTIRPDGRVQNVLQKADGRFQNLCRDNYRNIFAIFSLQTTAGKNSVIISDILHLNSDGTLNIKLYSQKGICVDVEYPIHMTKDDFGNIWICSQTQVNIFSYLLPI